MRLFSIQSLILVLVGLAAPLAAQARPGGTEAAERVPAKAEGVEVVEKLGAKLPLDARFRDPSGRNVRLRELFGKKRPVVLTLNYASCPVLCRLQLEGLVEAMRGLDWTAGKDYDLVTISLDPKETPTRTKRVQQRYYELYGRPEVAKGWHFLTGEESAIKSVALTSGFGYRYDEESGEYVHLAVAMLCSPEGKLCRYLYGVRFASGTLRLGLVEAGQGTIGSTIDRILLSCFSYDSGAGRYTASAYGLLRVGGILTILGMIVLFVVFRRRPANAELAQHGTTALEGGAS